MNQKNCGKELKSNECLLISYEQSWGIWEIYFLKMSSLGLSETNAPIKGEGQCFIDERESVFPLSTE